MCCSRIPALAEVIRATTESNGSTAAAGGAAGGAFGTAGAGCWAFTLPRGSLASHMAAEAAQVPTSEKQTRRVQLTDRNGSPRGLTPCPSWRATCKVALTRGYRTVAE